MRCLLSVINNLSGVKWEKVKKQVVFFAPKLLWIQIHYDFLLLDLSYGHLWYTSLFIFRQYFLDMRVMWHSITLENSSEGVVCFGLWYLIDEYLSIFTLRALICKSFLGYKFLNSWVLWLYGLFMDWNINEVWIIWGIFESHSFLYYFIIFIKVKTILVKWR